MVNLGAAVLEIRTDLSGVREGVEGARREIESLGATADQIESKLSFTQLAVSFDAVVQGVSRLGEGIRGAYGHLTEFTQQLAYVEGDSITIKTVFGEAADSIFEFGRTASDSIGLSAKAFNNLVAPIGTVLSQVAGLSKTDAAQWAIELAQRASDLAFAFETDVGPAVAAVGAAIRGEVEPMRRYGVAFTAAMVEQKAMAMTGKTVAETLTLQEKAMARVAIVMEQTSEFAGLYADNQDLLFQKQQKFNAELENLSGELGARLIPLNIKLLDIFAALPGNLQLAAYAVGTFGGDLINMTAGLGQAAIGLAGLASTIPKIAAAFAAMNISMTASIGVLSALVIVVGGAYLVWQKLSGEQGKTAEESYKLTAAQRLLETQTTSSITATRNQIAALLAQKEAEGASKESIDATKESLYIYNLALGMHGQALEDTAAKTDGTTTAMDEMLGVVDEGTPTISNFDLALDGVNEAFETMYGKANDAFAAIGQFRDVPTQESIDLDVAIAGVNLRLADEKVALDNAKAAGDELAAGIHETNITALEAEQDVLGNSKDAHDAARDMAIQMGEAKYFASDAAGTLGKTEADWRYAIDDYSRALSGQMSQAAETRARLLDLIQSTYDAAAAFRDGTWDASAYASYLYGIATAADTARGELERLQQIAANPVQVPVISPGPYSAPAQAAGTLNWPGGMTWVGEKGPELLNLPRGSDVFSNAASRRMLAAPSVPRDMHRAGSLANGTVSAGQNVYGNLQLVLPNVRNSDDLTRQLDWAVP